MAIVNGFFPALAIGWDDDQPVAFGGKEEPPLGVLCGMIDGPDVIWA